MFHHRWGACAAAAVWGALGLAVAIAPAAAQQAGSPVSFYAQTSVTMCIQAGGPIRELTPLVMGDCRGPAAAFVVDTREKKIRFHASPRFCIGFTNDGLAQVLQCDGTEQEYGYDRRTETIRFAPIPGTPADCLGVRGDHRLGARVQIERCTNANDQKYSMTSPVTAQAVPPAAAPAVAAPGQGRFLVNQLSGRCLDVEGEPGVANGTALTLADCETSGRSRNGSQTDQRWEWVAGGFIRNTLSGKCIDVSGAPGVADRARLQVWDCEMSGRNPNGSTTDQQWEITATGHIRNRLSGKCIDVPGAPGANHGLRLQLFPCEVAGGPTDQLWRWR